MTPHELATLHAAAFVQDRAWSASEFQDLLASPHTRLTKRPHGFALWRSVAGEAELLTIAVDPAHQGRGVGAELMRAWMAAAARTATDAFLEVASDNDAALSLYHRFGFIEVARRANYYVRPKSSAGDRADAVVMRAPLSNDAGTPSPTV